jgi:hypothetical protein
MKILINDTIHADIVVLPIAGAARAYSQAKYIKK